MVSEQLLHQDHRYDIYDNVQSNVMYGPKIKGGEGVQESVEYFRVVNMPSKYCSRDAILERSARFSNCIS